MSYDPDDFQDQAALLAALQRQRQLDLLSRKKVIPKDRACPWCGGELPGVVKKCMHCSSNVSWFEGQPCTPEDFQNFKKKAQDHENYLDKKTRCQDCKSESVRRDLTRGRCLSCHNTFILRQNILISEQNKRAQKSTDYGCLILFLLLVAPLLYFFSGSIAKGFPAILELGVFGIVLCLGIFSLVFIKTLEACESILCGILSLIILILLLSIILGSM